MPCKSGGAGAEMFLGGFTSIAIQEFQGLQRPGVMRREAYPPTAPIFDRGRTHVEPI